MFKDFYLLGTVLLYFILPRNKKRTDAINMRYRAIKIITDSEKI